MLVMESSSFSEVEESSKTNRPSIIIV
jgi:hypothetical protein